MSLLIVGSTSRITQHIILQLSKLNAYKSITITDLLPTYEFHNRYYRLRKALAESNSSTSVSLSKLTRTEQLYNQIKNHQDILFVTHDYFHSVTSKTKLMELTAEYSKNKENVHFATPVEYDHFGFENPLQNYLKSQDKILSINKNASFHRSDVQEGAELISYLHKNKVASSENLSFRVVQSSQYAESIAKSLTSREKGKLEIYTSENHSNYADVNYNKDISQQQTAHYKENVANFLSKYKGLPKVASSVS